MTYQFDLGLAALLDIEDERFLEASVGLVKSEEGLVRSLCCLVLGGCHDQLERVGGAKLDLLAEMGSRRQSVGEELVLRYDNACTIAAHFSLRAPPTPAPLLAMLRVASSKLHEAAAARPEPSDNNGRTIALENFMVVVLSLKVGSVGDEAREATWLLQLSADLPHATTRVSHLSRPPTARPGHKITCRDR